MQVLSGESGKPLAGVTVDLYQYNWQQGHRKVAERAQRRRRPVHRWRIPRIRSATGYFLFARQGSQRRAQCRLLPAFPQRRSPRTVRASLIYTDRSVYRPLQKVLWKVLAYGGRADQARYNTLPSTPVEVSLIDPNGQTVDARTVTTNGFGSAAGEFTIPAGRLLGNWRLRSSLNGQATIRVEEYKRPTFEVTFKDPESALRLNRPATFTGEVKYYFGLPVTSGAVKWRATREPVYPMWWGWYGTRRQLFAGSDRRRRHRSPGQRRNFQNHLYPRGGRAQGRRVERHHVSLPGERRCDGRRRRNPLGLQDLPARLCFGRGELQRATPAFSAKESRPRSPCERTDLNGAPRAGKGTWRLVTLQQPARTPLPADFPVQSANPARPARNAGEITALRGTRCARAGTRDYDFRTVLRGWPDGAERAGGSLTHDATSDARITLPALPAGAYRLHYQTTDDFGAACRDLVGVHRRRAKHDLSRSLPFSLPRRIPNPSAAGRGFSRFPVSPTSRILLKSGAAAGWRNGAS